MSAFAESVTKLLPLCSSTVFLAIGGDRFPFREQITDYVIRMGQTGLAFHRLHKEIPNNRLDGKGLTAVEPRATVSMLRETRIAMIANKQ
jgi:hypothetical protein